MNDLCYNLAKNSYAFLFDKVLNCIYIFINYTKIVYDYVKILFIYLFMCW